jgi:hypothetical protein
MVPVGEGLGSNLPCGHAACGIKVFTLESGTTTLDPQFSAPSRDPVTVNPRILLMTVQDMEVPV